MASMIYDLSMEPVTLQLFSMTFFLHKKGVVLVCWKKFPLYAFFPMNFRWFEHLQLQTDLLHHSQKFDSGLLAISSQMLDNLLIHTCLLFKTWANANTCEKDDSLLTIKLDHWFLDWKLAVLLFALSWQHLWWHYHIAILGLISIHTSEILQCFFFSVSHFIRQKYYNNNKQERAQINLKLTKLK